MAGNIPSQLDQINVLGYSLALILSELPTKHILINSKIKCSVNQRKLFQILMIMYSSVTAEEQEIVKIVINFSSLVVGQISLKIHFQIDIKISGNIYQHLADHESVNSFKKGLKKILFTN